VSELLRCTCDDFCDSPCPVHARENALQKERDAALARVETAERERDEAIAEYDMLRRATVGDIAKVWTAKAERGER